MSRGPNDTLRFEAAEPLYLQVKRFVLDGIRSGKRGHEKRVPSEQYLVAHVSVSRMTVHRELRELKSEGVIVRVPGRGSFVSPEKPRSTLLETQDIAEEIRGRGATYACRVAVLDEVRADSDIAVALDLKPGDPVIHSVIVHRENDDPVQFEERWVNPAVAPGYLDQDFTQCMPHRFLTASAPITEIEHILHAIRPGARAQEYLSVDENDPCLLLARRTRSGSWTATRSFFVYPGERYSLGGRNKVIGAAERPVLGSMASDQLFGASRPANASPARGRRKDKGPT